MIVYGTEGIVGFNKVYIACCCCCYYYHRLPSYRTGRACIYICALAEHGAASRGEDGETGDIGRIKLQQTEEQKATTQQGMYIQRTRLARSFDDAFSFSSG